MTFTAEQLAQLPSSFYRVTAKALIKDNDGRLLVVVNKDGHYEIPGGGLEHNETFEECLKRELHEELGIETCNIGKMVCVYTGRSPVYDICTIRIAAFVSLGFDALAPGDGMVDYRYITKDELLASDIDYCEGSLKDYVSQIFIEKE